MKLNLEGKAALITGGSQGIGLATAVRLAAEGSKVAISARNAENLEKAVHRIRDEAGENAEVLAIPADVTQKDDCVQIVKQTAEHFGRLDILVNNAGTSAAHPFEKVDDELWHHDLDLKLHAAIRCSREAVPYMREAGSGAIVNVTASVGKAPAASSLPTSVSRAAGMALTKALSRDLGPYGIRVNTVCIGLIRSAQIERRWQREAPELTWEQYAADPRHAIPLGRIGNADEAANVIAFLVSDAASYVTGTSVNIDGGKAATL
jgi:NAD(P)-dependent dehydrogenase (short-subunit alcohol dehydrogenase family)